MLKEPCHQGKFTKTGYHDLKAFHPDIRYKNATVWITKFMASGFSWPGFQKLYITFYTPNPNEHLLSNGRATVKQPPSSTHRATIKHRRATIEQLLDSCSMVARRLLDGCSTLAQQVLIGISGVGIIPYKELSVNYLTPKLTAIPCKTDLVQSLIEWLSRATPYPPPLLGVT